MNDAGARARSGVWILGAVLVGSAPIGSLVLWRAATSKTEIASAPVQTPIQARSRPTQSTELFVNVVLMNVRDQPETGAIVGKLPIATRCEGLDTAPGDWLRVRCSAVEGWAKREYLSPTIPTVDDLAPKMRQAPDPKEALQLALRVLALEPGSLEAEAFADAKFFESEWNDLVAERQAGRSRGEVFEHECGSDPNAELSTTICLKDALAAHGVTPEWLRIELRDEDAIVVSKEKGELYTRSGVVTKTGAPLQTTLRSQLDVSKHYRAPVMLSVLSGTVEASRGSTQHPLGTVGDVQDGCGCSFGAKSDSREELFVHEYGEHGAWVHTEGRDVVLACSNLFATKAIRSLPEKCESADGAIQLMVRYVPEGRGGYEFTPLRALISLWIGGATYRMIVFGGCGC